MIAERPLRISAVILVDHRGWVLLQERDEHAPVAPEQWGFVGGHAEDGEEMEATAYRELEEETGIALTSGLRLWRERRRAASERAVAEIWQVWVAATKLTDDDIVLGEGRQIVFVDPARVPELDLGGSAARLLTEFLSSPDYRELVTEASSL
ncbi:MAG TPA: NUDIX domain-containing protein [Nocardioidaceae bacterium]|nr:NUDIX domain-containing protein [Nocardioidaceae bacterium]